MKKYLIFLVISGAITLFLSGCKKDNDTHPEIETTQITALSPVTILAKGNIQNTGSFEVLDYGIMWKNSYSEYSPIGGSSSGEVWGTKASLGKNVKQGEFSMEITVPGSFNYSTSVQARAYIVNSNGILYGKVITVQLPTMSTPTLSKASGKAGELITINGQFYSLTKSDILVMFNNTSAEVTEVTPSKVTVKIPAVMSNYSYYGTNVSLKINNVSTTLTNSFQIVPNFTALLTTSGASGSTVYIKADNSLSDYNSNYKVYFGQTLAYISSIDGSQLRVIVPGNLTTTKMAVSVEYYGIKTVLPEEFTLISPTVTSLSTNTGFAGQSFYINGTNLANSTVTIGTTVATSSLSYSGTQLYVIIPATIVPGEYNVVVKSGPFTVESAQKLTVKTVSVTGFSPASGAVGKEVIVQGSFDINQSYSVYFGSTYSYVYNLTSTTLKAYVPGGVTLGNLKITVKSGSLSIDAPGTFTIVAPTITGFNPASAVAGTAVTITGTGFSQFSSVKFGTVAASILSQTDTSLTVAVPSGLSPGSMKISVTTNGQTVISSGNFTFTN